MRQSLFGTAEAMSTKHIVWLEWLAPCACMRSQAEASRRSLGQEPSTCRCKAHRYTPKANHSPAITKESDFNTLRDDPTYTDSAAPDPSAAALANLCSASSMGSSHLVRDNTNGKSVSPPFFPRQLQSSVRGQASLFVIMVTWNGGTKLRQA